MHNPRQGGAIGILCSLVALSPGQNIVAETLFPVDVLSCFPPWAN